ncbi:hypothetical protein [Pelagibius sp. 7325]|uniref:class I SAM-dependent methyltransferase n=1 Tax=Pelagibius sp. 7325 TaxID=3131994 RepID=UPI0030EF1284
MLQKVRRRILIERRRLAEWRARAAIKANAVLWRELSSYLEQTKSTGCNMTDYWVLYREIRRHKPVEVLECGTGVSTLVIAHALHENAAETGKVGRVTSMEEVPDYLEMSRALLPAAYQSLVDFRQSGRTDDCLSLFRGVRYEAIPERPYDFVFVDGPSYVSPQDGTPTFDFDYLHVLRRSSSPVRALVDKRVSTCFAFQQILGCEKVRYDPVRHLGFVAPCTQADLGVLETKLWSANFVSSFRAVTKTRLYMTPTADARAARQYR